jgi:excisionase family DNA binding protein
MLRVLPLPVEPPPKPREYLSPAQVAELLGLSVATLARWRRLGVGPTWRRCGDRLVRYMRSDLDAWMRV